MALNFPNQSRHYDEAMHAIRFWGHDGAMVAAFFVGEQALRHVRPGMSPDEAGMLEAFDVHRDRIYAAAVRHYARGRKGAYDLQPSDF
jgi:hypothetical protein